jgi:hypothetical protein
MTDESLRLLLHRADTPAPLRAPDAPSLRAKARARRTRQTLAATATLATLLALTPLLRHTPTPTPAAPSPTVAQAPAATDITARIATETALRLAQRRASGAFLDHDPLFAREAAAETLVLSAKRQQPTHPAEAARTFATAATLFPHTSWGRQAAALAPIQQ